MTPCPSTCSSVAVICNHGKPISLLHRTIMDCLLIVVLFLVYPVLQGYALLWLRDGLRSFAWYILIFVVLFSCLMIGSMFGTDNTVTFYNGVLQAVMIFIAWMLASLILLLLLLWQVATFSKRRE